MPLPKRVGAWPSGNYIEDKTGARFFSCNCPGTPAHRTQRFLNGHPEQFSLPPGHPMLADDHPDLAKNALAKA